MRYLVIGAGAIGGIVAARLHQAGLPAALVARGAAREAIAREGLQLLTPGGQSTHHLPVHGHPREAALRPGDAVVLAMKTQDTAAALQDLAACAPEGLHILCAQNGLENERLASRMFDRVYGMFVFLFGASLVPGEVRCYTAPSAGVLDLGRYPDGLDDTAQGIAADLCRAGFDAQARADIGAWKAGKLLANLGNALTASYGDSSAVPDLLAAAQAEGRACLQAAGLPFVTLEQMLDRRRHLLPLRKVQSQAFPGSSAWQSLSRGAAVTEVDYLTGEIVLLGRLHGVPTPLNVALQHQVRQMASSGTPPGTLDPDVLRRGFGLALPRG